MVYIYPIISDDGIDGCVCMWMDGLMDMTEHGCRQDEYEFAFTIQKCDYHGHGDTYKT
jgi:hypothetical protein